MQEQLRQEKQQHCIDQINRFTTMITKGEIDSNERLMQLGFNWGRLAILDPSYIDKHIENFEMLSYKKAIKRMETLTHDIHSQIQYGIALGVIQELTGKSHKELWVPIVNFAEKQQWIEIIKYHEEILRGIIFEGTNKYKVPEYQSVFRTA